MWVTVLLVHSKIWTFAKVLLLYNLIFCISACSKIFFTCKCNTREFSCIWCFSCWKLTSFVLIHLFDRDVLYIIYPKLSVLQLQSWKRPDMVSWHPFSPLSCASLSYCVFLGVLPWGLFWGGGGTRDFSNENLMLPISKRLAGAMLLVVLFYRLYCVFKIVNSLKYLLVNVELLNSFFPFPFVVFYLCLFWSIVQ